jgi:hypothetical protein
MRNMAEGRCIDFGKVCVGFYKTYTNFGKSQLKDGTIYQIGKFYIWIKK